jgi:hypothetical protein
MCRTLSQSAPVETGTQGHMPMREYRNAAPRPMKERLTHQAISGKALMQEEGLALAEAARTSLHGEMLVRSH